MSDQFASFLVFYLKDRVQKRQTRNFGLRRFGRGEGSEDVDQKSLSKAHGHCMLQRFAPQ